MKTKRFNLFTRALCCFFALQMALPASVLAQIIISVPTFPTTTTVHLDLAGAASTNSHIIFYSPTLAIPLAAWTRVTTGTVGQVSFDLTKPSNTNAFFAAGVAPIGTPTVVTPVFSPAGGSYGSPTNVTVTCATLGAAIYYTTNGNIPNTGDTYIYNGDSIYVSGVTTLRAKAFASGYDDSAVATATYTINSAPYVYAGAQQPAASSPTTLEGVVMDDGLTGGGTMFTNWTKISGPGTVTFGNSHQTNSTASFSANGIYVLQLSASDGQYTNSSLVTIAYNTTLSVSLTAPTDGSSYTVPTNILLQATASSTSGNVTQVLFYANSALIGSSSNAPFSLNWKSVPAGNLTLTAVAVSDDTANYSLASTPVNITVNWPTNVGQVTFILNDLQIPVAGFPIAVNRQYNSQYNTTGSFGYNGRLDYEAINIAKTSTLSDGYTAVISGGQDYIIPNNSTLVIITLGPGEQYAFLPRIVFQSGGQNHVGDSSVTFDAPIRFVFDAAGSTATLDPINAPSDVGMVGDEYYANSHWQGAIYAGYPDIDGEPLGSYEPDFSQFNFTAPDGIRYTFNSDGSIASKTDRNGNSLTYSSGGITHSSGKQITFTRDGNNRITEIYDPIALATSGSPALTYAYDGNGNLTNVAKLVQRSPAVYENTGYAYTNTSFIYNVTAVTDPRGVTAQRFEYDSSGRLLKLYDAFGRYTSYVYDTVNHKQIVTDRIGNSTVQNFTAAGELSSLQDAGGGVTTYTYDAQGRKISEVNALGQTTTYAYDANNGVTGVTNETGNTSSATYDGYGQPLTMIDARGYGTTNVYDANGNLLLVNNALGAITAYGYDALGDQIAITNGLGTTVQTVTLNQYNEFGDATNTIDALGNATAFTYDLNGNKLTQTTMRTASSGTQTLLTQWTYDAENRIIQGVEADGFTNKISYNGIGKQSQVISKLGRTTSYYYDAIGLLTNTTYADGLFETISYNAEGKKISNTDRGGHTTSYNYDALSRLVLTTYADGNYTRNGYDSAGRLKSSTQVWIISGGGMSPPVTSELLTSYSYDAAGRRVAVTNALNQGTTFAYDANGNQTNTVDALGHTTAYVYDGLNQRTKIIYPDNTSESYNYDALGRKVAGTNQAGIVTRFGFDGLGRPVAVTNAFGASQQMVTRYTYDEVGNLRQQIDGSNHTNFYEYDNLGHRIKQTLPAGQIDSFGYDAVGNLIRQTNFNSVVITNQYDALNRLTNKSSVNGYKITLAYSPTGQRTNMVDASGTNSYTYDSRDRLLTKATPQGTLTYTYDGFGNLATLQSSTASGVNLNYGYDTLNRLIGVTNVAEASSLSKYGFDAVGNLQTVQLPNNVTNTYTYDSLNRLTNLVSKNASGTVASFAYKLAAAGNRTNLVEIVNGVSRTNAWSYDPLYRLTNETITATSGGTISYKYDGVGNRTNRTSSVSGVSTVSASFNSNDQLTTDIYDNNGSTRTNGSNILAYDVENHLTNATVSGTNIVMIYDGDGNRVKEIIGTTTNFFLVDDRNPSGYAQVLEEKAGVTLTKTYTYGLDLISQRDVGTGTKNYYGYDGNGNTRFLTTTNGTISDTYIYDAFGVLITSTGTTANFYKYSGEQFDPNLGFYYLRSRYLNPNTGRFWTRDLFEGNRQEPRSLHKYVYAVNDPVDNVDPLGNIPIVSNFIYGNKVHQFIGDDFVATGLGAGRLYSQPISLILGVPWIPYVTAGQPDLVQKPQFGNPGEVYEIKPAGSFIEGQAQLQYYLFVLNRADPLQRQWNAGSVDTYTPPAFIPISFGVFAIATPPIRGVILYEVQDLRLTAIILGAYLGSQIKLDIGIATELNTLAPVF